jgi:hypothetical protein
MDKLVDLATDIYYSNEYVSLYLQKGEELFDFKYQEDDSIFINKTIKRPITQIGSIKITENYFDLESAYGYGGYYTNSNNKEFISRAMTAYKTRCKSENIIAEFTRYHPFNKFPQLHANQLDFCINDREVVVIDLQTDLFKNYKAKVRNTVKRSLENVSFSESTDLKKFYSLYSETMKKNNADEYYFFGIDFFQDLLALKNVTLYAVSHDQEVVAMAFFMNGQEISHYHLSANSNISYKLNANYAILHQAFLEAQKIGQKFFLLGGGTTSNIDDSLLRFKSKFSSIKMPFYIAGKIYNKEIYDRYNDIWTQQSDQEIRYFLKYRLS